MKKYVGVECHYLDGCVVEAGYIYMASQLDDIDPEEYVHTRMTGFDVLGVGVRGLPPDPDKPGNGWFCHDLNMHIISVCVKQKTQQEGRRLCALSKEGEIEIYSNGSGARTIEKIPDAGLRLSQYEGEGVTGYLTHIREIGGRLYTCGLSGQVYKRVSEGKWVHADQGLFTPITDEEADDVNSFSCIDGTSESDIYVVGDDGAVFYSNGVKWFRVRTPTDEHLLWVRCYGPDEVYICGYNGVLLRGNVRNGFKDVSAVEDNLNWQCLAKFRNKVYLSSNDGLYAWDGQKIAKVKTGLKPEPESWRLDTDRAGKTLWTFGVKDIAWFDGNKWQRLHHPDNPRIGE
jgi:hypothetical protein